MKPSSPTIKFATSSIMLLRNIICESALSCQSLFAHSEHLSVFIQFVEHDRLQIYLFSFRIVFYLLYIYLT